MADYIYDLIYFILVPVYLLVLMTRSCRHKSHFLLKVISGFVFIAVWTYVRTLLDLNQFFGQGGPMYFIAAFLLRWRIILFVIAVTFYMKLLFDTNINTLLFCSLSSFSAHQLMIGTMVSFEILLSLRFGQIGRIISELVFGTAFGVLLYFALSKTMTSRSLDALNENSTLFIVLLYIVAVLLILISTEVTVFLNMNFDTLSGIHDVLLGGEVKNAVLGSVLTNILGNLLVLLAMRNMLISGETVLDRQMFKKMYESDREQYEKFRSNVEYINAKTHDLNHYLALIKDGKNIPSSELEEVSESLSFMEAETNSGNESLDLVLTDRRLFCEKKGIELVVQTDGSALSGLNSIDIYTIFCNILDNAIEYVDSLQNKEDRIIRLGIRTFNKMTFIHEENPLSEHLTLDGGLPVTTKADLLLHGYGLKNVRNVVENHGGQVVLNTEGGKFCIDIYLPVES